MITDSERRQLHQMMDAGSFIHVRRVMVEELGEEAANSMERRAFLEHRALTFPEAVRTLVPNVTAQRAILRAHSDIEEARRKWHAFAGVVRRREVNREAQEIRRVLEEAGEEGMAFSAFTNKLHGFSHRPQVDDLADLSFVEVTAGLRGWGYRVYLRQQPEPSELDRKATG